MSDDKEQPTTTVKTLKFHTHQGEEHQEGDVYEAADADLMNLVAQGLVAVEEEESEAS